MIFEERVGQHGTKSLEVDDTNGDLEIFVSDQYSEIYVYLNVGQAERMAKAILAWCEQQEGLV